MPLKKLLATAPLFVTIALATKQDAAYDLVWRPIVNDEMTYKLRLDIDSSPDRFTFTEKLKTRVVKVKPNGDYDVQTTTSGAHVLHGIQDDPVPDDNKPTVDTYNTHGQKISSSEEGDPSEDSNPGFNTLDAVTDQLSPGHAMTIGSTWTAMIAANKKQNRAAGKVTYTLTNKEKQGKYPGLKVQFKYTETEKSPPITADGYILINQMDFSMLRFEGTIKAAKFSSDPDFPAGDAILSVIRE